MIKVVSVKFRGWGKSYYFDPGDLDLKVGDNVIVETVRGDEFGQVSRASVMVADDEVFQPLRPVKRIASDYDIEKHESHLIKEKEAFGICEEKIKAETTCTSRCIPLEQETIAEKCVCCGKPATKMVYWGKAY